MNNQERVPPIILKNCKKRNKKRIDTHIACTRDQTKQGIRDRFKSKRKEVCLATDPNRVMRGLFIQKKDKMR